MVRPKLFTQAFAANAAVSKPAARPAPKAQAIKKNKGSAADPSKPAVFLKGGKRCELSRRIARGGEGNIYTIVNDNTHCCKIFNRPLNAQQKARLSDTIEMFCRTMDKTPRITAYICPPEEIVYDREDKPVGYIMRLVEGGKPLSYFAEYDINFMEGYCREDQLLLCDQTAYVVGLLHTNDIVIGDLDDSNIIVKDNGAVVFVDLNGVGFGSYAAQGFHSTMMSPEHIVGRKDYILTKADDLWALQTIIFRLLLPSFEPYNYRNCKDDEEDITEGNYFWTDERRIVTPAAAALYKSLPLRLKVYFADCFHREGEYFDASKRPDAFTVMRMLHKCREDIRKG